MQAHSMFLQAAGASFRFVRTLAECAEPHMATPRQRALIAFAEKLTASPQKFSDVDTDRLREHLAEDGEIVEAATVVAGFNFANRVADALDVPLEVPERLNRVRVLRYAAMSLMSLGIRARMNFTNRDLGVDKSEDVLSELADVTERAGMGRVPAYFERLRVRPYILAGQAAICQSLLKDPGFPRELVLQIGYLISSLNRDFESVRESSRLLLLSRISTAPANSIAGDPNFKPETLDEEILVFARDVTLRASEITDGQVRSLARHGLSDRQILSLVLLSAAYNAGNRLNRAFSDGVSLQSNQRRPA